MIKVTYIGDVGVVSTRGYTFRRNEKTEVSKEVAEKLSGNRFFQVEEAETKKEPQVEEAETKKEPTVADYKTALKDANVEFDNAAKKDELKKLAEENNLSVEASQN